MKKDVIAAAFASVTLAFIAIGCRPRISQMSSTGTGKTALAAVSADPANLYIIAGVIVFLVGVAVLVFGGKITGAILAASGAGMGFVGKAMVLYPWLSLVFVLGASVIALVIAYDRHIDRKGGETVALAVESSGVKEQVTSIIKSQGEAAVKHVRHLIDPSKKKLKKQGKI